MNSDTLSSHKDSIYPKFRALKGDEKSSVERILDESDVLSKFKNHDLVEIESYEVPAEVFDRLPLILKECCNQFTSHSERNTFLLIALVAISGTLPGVKAHYNGDWVESNLYLYLLSAGGEGKGIIKLGILLLSAIQEMLQEETREAFEQYRAKESEYDTLRRAFEKNPVGDSPIRPEPPRKSLLIGPGNITKAGLEQIMEQNNGRLTIIESESQTVTDAQQGEHGKYGDITRKSFHHEPITSYRKTNQENISIRFPCLSMINAGTPNQYRKMFPSTDDGSFSRNLVALIPRSRSFHNVFDRTKRNYHANILRQADTLKRLYSILRARENNISPDAYAVEPHTEFLFTPDQERHFVELFGRLKRETMEEVSDVLSGTMNRMGLITFRIAMILSTLRAFEASGLTTLPNDIICQQEDYEAAIQIMQACRKNTELVFLNYFGKEAQAHERQVPNSSTDENEIKEILALSQQGLSVREISRKICGNDSKKSKVSRILLKYRPELKKTA
jgi:hypothetical protein